MSDKMKAHPSAATLEQAAGNGRADTSSCNDFTAIGGNSQQAVGLISSVLLQGEANAIPVKDLVTILRLKDLRELTRLVEGYIESLNRRPRNVRETREAVRDERTGHTLVSEKKEVHK